MSQITEKGVRINNIRFEHKFIFLLIIICYKFQPKDKIIAFVGGHSGAFVPA